MLSIFRNTFITSCNMAYTMTVENQQYLQILHIQNILRGDAAESVNSRNLPTWANIKFLLKKSRMRQLSNESSLTFSSIHQTHLAKVKAAVNKQTLIAKMFRAKYWSACHQSRRQSFNG